MIAKHGYVVADKEKILVQYIAIIAIIYFQLKSIAIIYCRTSEAPINKNTIFGSTVIYVQVYLLLLLLWLSY